MGKRPLQWSSRSRSRDISGGEELLGNQEWIGGPFNSLAFAGLEREGAECCGVSRGLHAINLFTYSLIFPPPASYLSGSVTQSHDPLSRGLQCSGCSYLFGERDCCASWKRGARAPRPVVGACPEGDCAHGLVLCFLWRQPWPLLCGLSTCRFSR